MNDIIIEGLSTVISLAVGGLIGYVIAYVTGLRAMRKGMQLILRASLNDMYIRYLKGETVEGEGKDGWTLVCVDGFPLGWAKMQKGRLKNKYAVSWKWE